MRSRCAANHPALAIGEEEAALFALEEGAFYGNLFVHEDDPIDWNACQGQDELEADDGGLLLRACTEPDPDDPTRTMCGFNYTGTCRNFTPTIPEPYACKRFANGVYGDCHDRAGDGRWPASRTYREVITVYVSTGL